MNYFGTGTSGDWREAGLLLVTMGILNDDGHNTVFRILEWASVEISGISSGNTSWSDEVKGN